VIALKGKLKAKSKVDVVRRGLDLLRRQTERETLREAYRQASQATRVSIGEELRDLEPLTSEGIDE
jgi:hypothetical protein